MTRRSKTVGFSVVLGLALVGNVGHLTAQDRFMFGFTGGPTVTNLVTDQGTFGWSDRGWIRNDGFHDINNDNYFTGFSTAGFDARSFFLFDLSTLSTAITTATLRVANPIFGFSSINPSELFALSGVDESWYDEMRATQFGNIAFYNAMAGVSGFGSRSVSSADDGTNVDFILNATAIAAINAAMGGEWAVAGCLDGVNCGRVIEPPVGTVPEPATMTLLATGLAGMVAARRRKRA